MNRHFANAAVLIGLGTPLGAAVVHALVPGSPSDLTLWAGSIAGWGGAYCGGLWRLFPYGLKTDCIGRWRYCTKSGADDGETDVLDGRAFIAQTAFGGALQATSAETTILNARMQPWDDGTGGTFTGNGRDTQARERFFVDGTYSLIHEDGDPLKGVVRIEYDYTQRWETSGKIKRLQTTYFREPGFKRPILQELASRLFQLGGISTCPRYLTTI